MKLALLGDIHGNHLALAAVLAAARRLDVERLLITGDLVGYYFWPAEVMQLLAPWDRVAVRGNHEDMLAQAREQPESLEAVDRKYGTGLRVAMNALDASQLEWLARLPHPLEMEIEGTRILLCHGSPWDVDQYIYPDAETSLFERCAAGNHDWVVLGHTHHSMQREYGTTHIVNPGSVGQPRDRRPGAHWALLDTATGRVEQFCETYDLARVAEEARRLQPDVPYLWKVLGRT